MIEVLQKHYQAAQQRQMGSVSASVFVVLWLFAYVFLCLEGPTWQGLWQRYQPWFKHLTLRPYQPADPIRYAIQVLWLVFIRIPATHTHSFALGLKKCGTPCYGNGALYINF